MGSVNEGLGSSLLDADALTPYSSNSHEDEILENLL